jgi:hypothetical protein
MCGAGRSRPPHGSPAWLDLDYAYEKGVRMAEDLQTLIAIQAWVLQCRRLAADMPDLEIARQLLRLADRVERRAREVDAEH